ncbi:heterokaryon incompatibility protein-domain-containing protein [Xylaria digitata]|nr:heterokaryon incompatibility protein-domain-containing protein [Xylaria digitata]
MDHAFESMDEPLQVLDNTLAPGGTGFKDFLKEFGVDDQLARQLEVDYNNRSIEEENLELQARYAREHRKLIRESTSDQYDFETAILEIISSTIFELLTIFPIDLIAKEVPFKRDKNSYLQLLRHLHEKTKDMKRQVAQQTATKASTTEQTKYAYEYQIKLDLATSQFRVIELLPGSEDDPIICHLKKANVHEYSIKEVRSLFRAGAGSEKGRNFSNTFNYMLFGLKPSNNASYDYYDAVSYHFHVTKNLYEIIHTLRNSDVTQVLWIDAICIDQQNLEEKVHQVRLMREIYSKAWETTIWLSADQMASSTTSGPIPPNFGGTKMHKHDLSSILQEFEKTIKDFQWDIKEFALFTMLFHRVKDILSHKWWERIWTLQEGVLPSGAVIICFRGYRFPLSHVEKAIEALGGVSPISGEELIPIANKILRDLPDDTGTQQLGELIIRIERIATEPLLLCLRRASKNNKVADYPFVRLIRDTAAFRAKDP